MEDRTKKSRKQRGLSLLEMVIAIIILVTLAGVIAPFAKSMVQDAKVAKILDLYQTVSKALRHFYVDTGTMPLNGDGTLNLDLLFNYETGTPPDGWKGPYVDRYLSNTDNPSGTPMGLGKGTVFYLTGDTKASSANTIYLEFTNISQDIASTVDQNIDKGIPHNIKTWQQGGRSMHVVNPSYQNPSLYLFILDPQ